MSDIVQAGAGPVTQPVSEPADGRARHRGLALGLILLAQLLVVIDVSIVTLALPAIQRGLGFSPVGLQWVLSAYALAFGGFLLLGGRLADLLGRRRVLITGAVVFTGASLACGLAGSASTLIAARAVEGLGAALMAPAALALILVLFPEGAERNKALGAFGAVTGAPAERGAHRRVPLCVRHHRRACPRRGRGGRHLYPPRRAGRPADVAGDLPGRDEPGPLPR